MADITFLDGFALAWFLGLWVGYGVYSRRKAQYSPGLINALRVYRRRWMVHMVERDNHQVDAMILSNLLRGAFFFASTTIFILGGLIALLGTTQKVVDVVAQLPFSPAFSVLLWQLKVVMLIAIFAYAFFKFTWSSWQYNALSILVGSASAHAEDPKQCPNFIDCATSIAAFAGENFNKGMRAYYLSMAALAWFLHPWLLIVITTLVIVVLYRREFRSKTLQAFMQDIDPGEQMLVSSNSGSAVRG